MAVLIRASSQTILTVTSIILGTTVLAFTIEGLLLGWMANTFAVYDKMGMIGLLATPLFSLGVALIVPQLKLKPESRNISRIKLGSGTAFVAAVLMVIAMARAVANTPDNSTANHAVAPPVSPGSTTATPRTPSGVPVPSNTGCPLPDPTDPQLPSVEIKVVYWCKGDVLIDDDQLDNENYQIKVRPRLVNNTASSMNISVSSPSTIRLLVTGKQMDERWSPPPLTKKLGDQPILVTCNGGTFWAIPPNAPR
ncbi:MAG: hypothetical protein LC775_12430, partial [Acidobacteria bacterium]|nr:hypothetical protein [Acidobacteriota bacterium]